MDNYSKETKPLTEEWYRIASSEHFWLRWRWRVFEQTAKKSGLSLGIPMHALDVGCGHGQLMTQIEEHTQWDVDGVDIQSVGFPYAHVKGNLYELDILEPQDKLRKTYDLAFLFDILEHLDKPENFVSATVDRLTPGGFLCVNVPALPWIGSRYDKVVGHLRRYTRSTVADVLNNDKLEIVSNCYWGMSCVPLLLIRKLYIRFIKDTDELVQKGFRPPSKLINSGLDKLGALETSIVPSPPFGTSVLAIARKL